VVLGRFEHGRAGCGGDLPAVDLQFNHVGVSWPSGGPDGLPGRARR
jgi:hypothetical protein